MSHSKIKFLLRKFTNKRATIREKFVAWWNENHPDCQITVDSIDYREDEDPSSYNVHWSEYGD